MVNEFRISVWKIDREEHRKHKKEEKSQAITASECAWNNFFNQFYVSPTDFLIFYII